MRRDLRDHPPDQLRQLAGNLRPTVMPDWNNLGGVTDALNGIVWHDDRQIVQGIVTKVYGDRPCLVIRASPTRSSVGTQSSGEEAA